MITTEEHIKMVANLINEVILELACRSLEHDASKLKNPEVEIFNTFTPMLESVTYGSNDYFRILSAMKPAIEHHYKENRHHPEFYKNGVNDMSLTDIVEMLCDWKAASMRNKDGDIFDSIKINKKRFNLSSQLTNRLVNSI